MNRILRTEFGTFELLTGRGPYPDRDLRRFMDGDEALRFLRLIGSDPVAMAALRAWAQELDLGHPQDNRLLERLAADFGSERLRLAVDRRLPFGTGTGAPARPRPPRPGPPPAPRPEPPPEVVTELVVHVRDEDGNPVEDANVVARGIGERPTDEQGVANYGRVKPGNYTVTAEKPGHAPSRDGRIGMDRQRSVPVPIGSRTEVHLIQHPQCPNVAYFTGTPRARIRYFGFDHKTNMPVSEKELARLQALAAERPYLAAALPRTSPYWKPVPEKRRLELEGDTFFSGDGTPWISVARGQEAEVVINFAFRGLRCIPCIANTRFKVQVATVCEVVTAKVVKRRAFVTIRGMGMGRTTVEVICDGHVIGRLFVWCRSMKTIKVDVATLVTNRGRPVPYDYPGLTAYMQEVFRQALVEISFRDLGTVDLSDALRLSRDDKRAIMGMDPHRHTAPDAVPDRTALLHALDDAARKVLDNRADNGIRFRDDAYRIYFFRPLRANVGGVSGTAAAVPSAFAFAFLDGRSKHAFHVAAHELGHCLGLCHPRDDGTPEKGPSQFTPHNQASLGLSVPRFPRTNTEPSSRPALAHPNVMANDPSNLMGYPQWVVGEKSRLRYHQWVALHRAQVP